MRREFLAVAFALMFCGGLVVGLGVSYLTPEKTIEQRLREADVQFYRDEWYDGWLEVAECVQSFRNFQRFVWAYEEKCDPQYNPDTHKATEVYVDTNWKVVWIEANDNDTGELVYVGFYFY